MLCRPNAMNTGPVRCCMSPELLEEVLVGEGSEPAADFCSVFSGRPYVLRLDSGVVETTFAMLLRSSMKKCLARLPPPRGRSSLNNRMARLNTGPPFLLIVARHCDNVTIQGFGQFLFGRQAGISGRMTFGGCGVGRACVFVFRVSHQRHVAWRVASSRCDRM